MNIIRTKVFPKVERDAALKVLLADHRRGWPVLFAMADRAGGKISGCRRAAKKLSRPYCEGDHAGRPCLSNYGDGFHAMTEQDIEACVKGFAKAFPCEFGWVMSVEDCEAFLAEFGTGVRQVDQNTFLPAAARVFAFGGWWGTMAVEARTLSIDHAVEEIAADIAQEPFKAKSWSYVHFWLDTGERGKIAQGSKWVGRNVGPHAQAMAKSVESRPLPSVDSPGGSRVTLSGPVRHWLKPQGYARHKAASEPRLTVFDKLTPLGNLIRIEADAGGHGDLVPYIQICVEGAGFRSPGITIVKPERIESEEQLAALLAQHTDDVRYYEAHIAPAYDAMLGPCPSALTELMRGQQIRVVR